MSAFLHAVRPSSSSTCFPSHNKIAGLSRQIDFAVAPISEIIWGIALKALFCSLAVSAFCFIFFTYEFVFSQRFSSIFLSVNIGIKIYGLGFYTQSYENRINSLFLTTIGHDVFSFCQVTTCGWFSKLCCSMSGLVLWNLSLLEWKT